MLDITDMIHRTVPDTDIEPEPAFLLSWGSDSDRLKASLKAVGQISPLVLWPNQNRLKLLCGRRRRRCLRESGKTEFSAIILPENVLPQKALDFALEENLGHRTFNEAEKVLALSALNLYFPPENIVERYLKRLDIPPKMDFFYRYLHLAALGPEGLDALARELIDPETGEKLAGMNERDGKAVFQLLKDLRPGRNRRREILEWSDEIGRREGLSVSEVLQDSFVTDIIKDSKLNRPQKETGVRKALLARRFPRLTEMEKQRAAGLKSLALPANIRLICPQNFEGLDFTLELSFSDMKDFRQGIAFLKGLEDSEDLAELITLG